MPRRSRKTRIGNYVLHDHLARGGFGSIYRASELGPDDSVLRTDVAIKIMHTFGPVRDSNALRDWTAKELYGMDFYHANLMTYYTKGDSATTDVSEDFGEKLLCGQRDPGVVRHTLRRCKSESVGQQEKFIWIAMPFTTTGSLGHVSKERFESGNPYTVLEAISVIKQIISGVEYLHSRGYIHRDLKPENVLYFEQDARWIVSDYGLLGKLENGFAPSYGWGTRNWSAPEQFAYPVDIRADIYPIGQIFYYLLTGEYRFSYQLRGGPSALDLNPKVSQNLSDLITRCIEFEPEHRYPNLQTMSQDLEEIESQELVSISNHADSSNLDVDCVSKMQAVIKWFNHRGQNNPYELPSEEDDSVDEGEGLEEFEESETEDYLSEESEQGEYELEVHDSSLWGPCSFYATLYSIHGSTVRYQHAIENKRYSIYVPKALLKAHGYGDQNSEYPLELKVSYRETAPETEDAVHTSEPTDKYWDFKYYDWHSDTIQYRLYVNRHYYRIYVPKIALEDRQPQWIRVELQIED